MENSRTSSRRADLRKVIVIQSVMPDAIDKKVPKNPILKETLKKLILI
jgi:hypothetical protein